MSEPRLLPLLDAPHPERRDAARNREALLLAAQRLVDHCGVDGVTMDAVAHEAGVGKGTVFRRFVSREGLMAALLNFSETEWQAAVMSGPPPLGPGAEPWDRLMAFGRSRLETTIKHADLIRHAGRAGSRSFAAYSFVAMHVRYLLGELHVTGDLPLLATALMAPLEAPILDQQVRIEGLEVDRVYAGWVDLARRVVRSP
ncbi:AcrR family transcriptional regulator [Nocardioides ginsengisegetis]|uniref:AcrR family transcriptional regulator n=1 Tax=Nocardioides ginsengisegetis TaxID=661491 RepID=A0A7W3PA72_9ACTN|nr:TetR/AcrR family transcriptional regulator [Nocardioides ginsengisegetis]MBA8804194.1 AcrR family transcriptional regulator [Nocardioides ginsengisegetis]